MTNEITPRVVNRIKSPTKQRVSSKARKAIKILAFFLLLINSEGKKPNNKVHEIIVIIIKKIVNIKSFSVPIILIPSLFKSLFYLLLLLFYSKNVIHEMV
jgi:hypothetical protein